MPGLLAWHVVSAYRGARAALYPAKRTEPYKICAVPGGGGPGHIDECLLSVAPCHGRLLRRLPALPRPQVSLSWSNSSAVTVVMAAKGYPGSYKKGTPIRGLEAASQSAKIFHAGTALDASGQLVANGGRVLNVTALGADVAEAQAKAYQSFPSVCVVGGRSGPDTCVGVQRQGRLVGEAGGQRIVQCKFGGKEAEAFPRRRNLPYAVKQVQWDDAYYRNDIAWRAIARMTKA
eukprot:352218-Chlamydomonas_euryale.AAC.4